MKRVMSAQSNREFNINKIMQLMRDASHGVNIDGYSDIQDWM